MCIEKTRHYTVQSEFFANATLLSAMKEITDTPVNTSSASKLVEARVYTNLMLCSHDLD